MTKKEQEIRRLVEEAKKEARQNLSGEDLEKCLTALDNWERNELTVLKNWGARYAYI